MEAQRELISYAFAVEVSGALGKEAEKFLAEILNYMADSCGSSVLKDLREDLLRTIALKVQMGNASMIRISNRISMQPKR